MGKPKSLIYWNTNPTTIWDLHLFLPLTALMEADVRHLVGNLIIHLYWVVGSGCQISKTI